MFFIHRIEMEMQSVFIRPDKVLGRFLWSLIFLMHAWWIWPQATRTEYDFSIPELPLRWDEALPQGNGWLGALVWQKGQALRLSLDRIDLWDERPMPEIDRLRFAWVYEQVLANNYDTVQKLGDRPYEVYPAPTKLPGAALEFDFPVHEVKQARLALQDGQVILTTMSGITFEHFVHADQEFGYFRITGHSKPLLPKIIRPEYQMAGAGTTGNSVEGQSLSRLGYPQGRVTTIKQGLVYHQTTWGGHYYEVRVDWFWDKKRQILQGSWTISRDQPAQSPAIHYDQALSSHQTWWDIFWSQSQLTLDDREIEKQYVREMYKFGCVVRPTTSPIALQAVWTADEGKLPPWKGDLHHDLNTQLSYWPGYTANHLDLTQSYTDWLWAVKETNRHWTERMFALPGINVPGVTTRLGVEMGGWIQYSMSPTTACWLAQHMYWQFAYTLDTAYLLQKGLPYIQEVGRFVAAYVDNYLQNKPFLSSSPEYHNNSVRAWFRTWTNYDLSLVKYVYHLLEQLSRQFPDQVDVALLRQMRAQPLPDYAVDSTGLLIAQGQPLDESHRHHAHLMPVQPLGLLNIRQPKDREVIRNSLRHLEKQGTRLWTGYSFCWAACIYARAAEGDRALDQLQKFTRNFISPNSFHLNGDQRGGEFSNFTYRPFTLEGNFAFAQGVHELLLQSHQGYVEIIPALPVTWQNLSFSNFRAEGAFLVSAEVKGGLLHKVRILAEQGGQLRLRLPHLFFRLENLKPFTVDHVRREVTFETRPGEVIELSFM